MVPSGASGGRRFAVEIRQQQAATDSSRPVARGRRGRAEIENAEDKYNQPRPVSFGPQLSVKPPGRQIQSALRLPLPRLRTIFRVPMEKVVIIGSGCAGWTAALYTARADLKPLVLTGKQPGGLLTTTSIVENFPGFPEGVDGYELMTRMQKQAERFGARRVSASVEKVDFSRKAFRADRGRRKSRGRNGHHRHRREPQASRMCPAKICWRQKA